MDDLVKKWNISKKDSPEETVAGQVRPKSIAVDRLRADIYASLIDFDAKIIKKNFTLMLLSVPAVHCQEQ